jgi:hypothetical protein
MQLRMGISLDYNKFPYHLGMWAVDIHLKKVKFHILLNKAFLQLPKLCSVEWVFVNDELK